MKAKDIALICMGAYILGHNIDCRNDRIKQATWRNGPVDIITADSTKSAPQWTNYAVKTGPSETSFVIMDENNLYLQIRGSSTWREFKGGYEKAEALLKNTQMYSRIGVMSKDTIYDVTNDNLLLGLEGIGGYEPIRK